MEPCGTTYIDNIFEEIKLSTDDKFSIKYVWGEPLEGIPRDTNPCSQSSNNNAIIHCVKHSVKIKQDQHWTFTCISIHQDIIDNS